MNSTDGVRINSPYPGIRPVGHRGQLVGRDPTVRSITEYLESNYPRLIELYGQSGVGKSSLLRAGVVPGLEDLGWHVLLISDWDGIVLGTSHAEDPDPYVAVVLRAVERLKSTEEFPPWIRDLDSGNFWEVMSGRRTVVILDQFEELMRVDPPLARSLLARVCDLVLKVDGNWHIVSFRPEVRHDIAALVERRLPIANWTAAGVEPVEGVEVETLVRGPLELDGAVLGHASEEFISTISGAWEALSAGQESLPFMPNRYIQPGLLHLQALLAVCWDLASKRPSGDDAVLDVDLLPAHLQGDSPALFDWGLKEYLRTRITEAANALGRDPRSRRALRQTAASIVPHLWSSGFKTFQETEHLALMCLPRLDDLRLTPNQARMVLGVAARHKRPLSGESVFQDKVLEPIREIGDPTAVAGIAAASGFSPLRVVSELAVEFEKALEILKSEAIIRVTQGHDLRIVGMNHDAYGEPLAAWMDEELGSPWVEIDSMVMVSGEQVIGRLPALEDLGNEAEWQPEVTRQDYGTLDHLMWVGCQITGRFRDVTFTNCWFNGSVFNRCRFENVRFENCVFWGAAFMNCEFVGEGDVAIEGGGELRTLTFLWHPDYQGARLAFAKGGALRLDGLIGYGLFVEGGDGGPIRLTSAQLAHVKFTSSDNGLGLGPIEIENSQIRHLQVDKNVKRRVGLTGKTSVRFADVVDDRLDDVFECSEGSVVSDGPS